MSEKKLYSLQEAKNLDIKEVQKLYQEGNRKESD